MFRIMMEHFNNLKLKTLKFSQSEQILKKRTVFICRKALAKISIKNNFLQTVQNDRYIHSGTLLNNPDVQVQLARK